jgi:RecA-family ATPase
MLDDYESMAASFDVLAGDAIKPMLTVVEIGDVMSVDMDPPAWVIDTLVPRGHVTLLGGHGGAGKTILALAWAAHAACGRDWAGLGVDHCRVVYVALEDAAALMRYRLRRIIEVYRLDADAIAANLVILDGTDEGAALAIERNAFGVREISETRAIAELEAASKGAGLVIVDNASDAFAGDENNRRQVRSFLHILARIARANDLGVVLLAHIDKFAARHGPHGNSYSGSTAWHNSVRSRLALATDDAGLALHAEKNNLAPLAEPIALGWDGPVVIPSNVNRIGREHIERQRSTDDAVRALEVIRIAIENGETVPAAMNGPATAWRALEPYPEFSIFQGKDGKRRFRAAIVMLQREKRIAKVRYQDAHRNARERIELTQTGAGCVNGDAENLRELIPPYPPTRTNARAGGALVGVEHETNQLTQTNATDADCPRCDGEGCAWCNDTGRRRS